MISETDIRPLGRVAVESFGWDHEGRRRLTLVAKATFALAEDTPRLVDPAPFRRAAGHEGDLAPFRDRADVLVFGDPDAFPSGVPVTVTGEAESWTTAAAVLPDRGIPARVERSDLAVPEGIDWGAYQEAPRDQQTGLLRGDERIEVGPHRFTLPGARGVIYLADPGAPARSGDRMDLYADSLQVDLVRGTCSLVYRGVFLADEADDLDGRVVHVGLEEEDPGHASAAFTGADLAAEALPGPTHPADPGARTGAPSMRAGQWWREGAAGLAWGDASGRALWAGEGATREGALVGSAGERVATGSAASTGTSAVAASSGAAAPAGYAGASAGPAGEAGAYTAADQQATAVRRSKASSLAPTLPATNATRAALYEKFGAAK